MVEEAHIMKTAKYYKKRQYMHTFSRTSIYVESALLKKAQELNLNISSISRDAIKQIIEETERSETQPLVERK